MRSLRRHRPPVWQNWLSLRLTSFRHLVPDMIKVFFGIESLCADGKFAQMTSPSRCRRPSAEFFLTIQNLQRSLSNVGVLNIFDFRVSIRKGYAWPCSASVAESRVINHLYWFFLVVKFRSAWLPLLILNEPIQNNLPKLSLTFEAFLEALLCVRPKERKD